MYFSNCGGCIQVPVPVQYWSPYISPRKTPTFHIADIWHQQMTTAIPQVCQNVNVSRKNVQDSTDFKYKSVSGHSKRTEFVQRLKETDRATHTSKQDKLSRISDNIMKLKQSGDSVQCSLPSALAPLQALCSSDVKCYNDRSKDSHKRSSENTNSSNHLKFGINRILSEDFGKETTEKENDPENTQEFEDVQCDCSEYRQLSYSNYALSAVHAIQPPRYPSSSSGTDTLPGPYSILNTDVNNGGQGKRKRSWSRAVFSNLQRKGLEKRFEVQKYVTKPDRRQLAAMLGLTDAQVKVWFQNRRMKWRHTQQQQTDEDKVDKNQSSGSEVTEADMDDSVESHDHDDVNSEQDSPDKD